MIKTVIFNFLLLLFLLLNIMLKTNGEFTKINSTLSFLKTYNLTNVYNQDKLLGNQKKHIDNELVPHLCNSLHCSKNCELNLCLGTLKSRRIQYIITSIIVACIILLMLITFYACQKERKKNRLRWQMMENNMRFRMHNRSVYDQCNMNIDSFVYNCNVNLNTPDIELLPMSTRPPPYHQYYSPPPDYDEATKFLINTQN